MLRYMLAVLVLCGLILGVAYLGAVIVTRIVVWAWPA